MKKCTYLIIICSVMLSAMPALFAGDPAPLPPDLNIVAPDKGTVPERLAEFSGIWEGYWHYRRGRGINQVKFAVEDITPEKATVVYAWGAADFGNNIFYRHVFPGWYRSNDCTVEKAADGRFVITARFPWGAVFVLKQTGDRDHIFITANFSPSGSQDFEYTSPFYRKK